MDAADGGVDATELIMIVEIGKKVCTRWLNIANGVEGSYLSQALRYYITTMKD